MEGTRNEKAVILVCAYVIGFVTAYILYGSPQTAGLEKSAIAGAPVALPLVENASGTEAYAVAYEVSDDGFYVVVNGDRRLISLDAEALPEEDVEMLAEQGAYDEIGTVSMSESGRFVYFCEQSPEKTGCVPFVYDVVSQTVHSLAVVEAGEEAIAPEQLAFAGEVLVSSAYQSINPERPWEVSGR